MAAELAKQPRIGRSKRPNPGAAAPTDAPPERALPVAVVVAHGVLAVTTAVLVLLTMVGVGTGQPVLKPRHARGAYGRPSAGFGFGRFLGLSRQRDRVAEPCMPSIA